MDGQGQEQRSHWFLLLVLVLAVAVLLILFIRPGATTSSNDYLKKAASAPAEHPGLVGVPDQYRVGVEAARTAPAVR